jgi:hypothetical protein
MTNEISEGHLAGEREGGDARKQAKEKKRAGVVLGSHSSQLTQSRFACLGRQKFQIYRAHRCHQALRQR